MSLLLDHLIHTNLTSHAGEIPSIGLRLRIGPYNDWMKGQSYRDER